MIEEKFYVPLGAMKDKTDNKAQVRCAQKLCGILAPRRGKTLFRILKY